jgi:hypothetical protein
MGVNVKNLFESILGKRNDTFTDGSPVWVEECF